jgi:hypothetical protein
VKHGGGLIMVWAYMTIQGCRLFIKIIEKENQFSYKEILEVGLSSTICRNELDPISLIFQQNNASIHTTSFLKEWIKNQHFSLLQWLVQSPDLIGHWWALVKRQLNQYESAPSGMLELWNCV